MSGNFKLLFGIGSLLSCCLHLHLALDSAHSVAVDKIAVGAIFDQDTEEIQNVFKYAMSQQNQINSSHGSLELQAHVDVVDADDPFELSRLICKQFARGVWTMLGAVTDEPFHILHSHTNIFHMPFVTPLFPEKVILPSSSFIEHSVSVLPSYHKAVVDAILHYEWTKVIYLFDSNDGLLRLQQVYDLMPLDGKRFQISNAMRIKNASDAMDFILTLEKRDRRGYKRIVLDCSATTAKSIVMSHLQDDQLSRQTYHYLVSGLVMDDHWEEELSEYDAINITGFRIVDHSRKIVRDVMDGLRTMDPQFNDTITAQAALMYDGVQVVIDALGKLWRKKPDVFRNALRRAAEQNSTKFIDCNPAGDWIVPFEHGNKIYQLIKKTEIEGLTGHISFDEEGHRHHFTLHVVEMTAQHDMAKIATWSDIHGLIPTHPKYKLQTLPDTLDTNKTFIVTTILQEPFMMHKPLYKGQHNNDQFYGLCKDLLDYIAWELGIKYELQVVKGGYYGNPGPNGWNGLIGELVRKEADIAVAPLVVTADRDEVVDFSEPFLTFDYPSKDKKNYSAFYHAFSFLKPMTKEIMLCVIFTFFAVSIVLFFVSRFTSDQWKYVSISDSQLDQPVNSTNEITLHNDFCIWTTIWYTLGSFLRQGSNGIPRSLSENIISIVWGFFALMIVCSYTALFAAYLIMEQISVPLGSELKAFGDTEILETILNNNLVAPPATTNIDDKSALYTTAKDGRYICNSATTDCRPEHVDFAIASSKDSNLREAINLGLTNMKNTDFFENIVRKWLIKYEQSTICSMLKRKEEEVVSGLTVSDVAGVFYLLLGGLAMALGVAFFEFFRHGSLEAACASMPLHAALFAKAKLAMGTDREILPREKLDCNGTQKT